MFTHRLILHRGLLAGICLLLLASPCRGEDDSAAKRPRKILIFTMSGGTTGHLGISKAIRDRIRERDPSAQIQEVDLYELAGPFQRRLINPLFWWLTQKTPNLMDSITAKVFSRETHHQSMVQARKDYNLDAVAEVVRKAAPDAMIFTHYGSASLVGRMRELGEFRDIPMGYVQSEALEAFFPRIAAEMDRTFLADPASRDIFTSRGVAPDRLSGTGVPLSPEVFQPLTPEQRAEYLRSLGFSPEHPVITMAAGGGGMMDLPAAVKRIVEAHPGQPLQLIVLAGMNEENARKLETMAETLPPHIRLKVYTYVKPDIYWNAMKSADLYVGKAGGIAATAVFQMGKPAVFLNLAGGFERNLNRHFQRSGLAAMNHDIAELGNQVKHLLSDPGAQEAMIAAQRRFQQGSDPALREIVDFALHGVSRYEPPSEDLGTARGTEPKGVTEALTQLHRDAPSGVELLFSYPPGKDGSVSRGRLALRVGDTVFVRDGAQWRELSLRDYLYGTRGKGRFGETFGVAYRQETLGLRLRDLPESVGARLREALTAPHPWRRVREILGFGGGGESDDAGQFRRALDQFRRQAHRDGNLVSYDFIATPEALREMPREAGLEERMRWHARRFAFTDPFQEHVDKRVRLDPTTPVLSYDNVTRTSAASPRDHSVPPALRDAEVRLADRMHGLREHQLAPDQIQSAVGELRERLGKEAWERVSSGHLAGLDEEKKRLVEELKEKIRRAHEHWREINREYDNYQRDKTAFLIDRTLESLENEVARLSPRVSPKERNRWEESLSRLRNLRDRYRSLEPLYGQPKDYQRVMAGTAFFRGARDVLSRMGASFSDGRKAPSPPYVTHWGEAAKALPPLLKTLGLMAFHPSSPGLSQSLKQATLPAQKAMGLQVNVQGREHLSPASGPRDITLYVAHHGTGSVELLGATAAGIPWERAGVFAAPDIMSPRFVGDVLEKNPGFIVVGRGSGKPWERMQELLTQGQREFVILPDGFTGLGLHDVLPVREKWSEGLLKGLEKAGWRVRLVNVAFPDNLTLGNDVRLTETNRAMRVVIAPPLEPADLGFITSAGGGHGVLGTLVRTQWLDRMHSETRPAGSPPLADLAPRLASSVAGAARFCVDFYRAMGGNP